MDLGSEGSSVKIGVKMFGEFSITINGNTLTNLKGRTKRVWMLIQYLIVRRFDPAPIDRLIGDIWDGKSCGDPENALKNLVYRARTLLRELSGQPLQFIVFLNGTYAWHNQYECDVDAERFLQYAGKAGRTDVPEKKRIAWYRKAIGLYRGDFLPKSAYSSWVITLATRYAALYNRCVREVCGLLAGQGRYDEIVPICEAALRLFPYEEPTHLFLLRAYLNTDCRKKAFDHYNRAVKMFYREFGVDLSDFFRSGGGRPRGSARPESDLETIRDDLKEKADPEGAFFCDYDMFKCMYRSQVRLMPRTGHSVFLILFTLRRPDGGAPAPETLKAASEKLKTAILTGMRKGDIVASCSSTQYIAMLQTVTVETAQGVVKRILRRFKFEYRRNAVKVVTKITSLIE